MPKKRKVSKSRRASKPDESETDDASPESDSCTSFTATAGAIATSRSLQELTQRSNASAARSSHSQGPTAKRRRLDQELHTPKLEQILPEMPASAPDDLESTLGPVVELFKGTIMTLANLHDAQTRQECSVHEQRDAALDTLQGNFWEKQLEFNTLRRQHTVLETNVEASKSESNALKRQLEELQQTLGAQGPGNKDQIESLHRDLESKSADVRVLQEKIQAQEGRNQTLETDHQTQLNYLKSQLANQDKLREALESLTTSLRAKEQECLSLREAAAQVPHQVQSNSSPQKGSSRECGATVKEIMHLLRNALAHSDAMHSYNKSSASEMETLYDTLAPFINSSVKETFEKIKSITKDLKSSISSGRKSIDDARTRARWIEERLRLAEKDSPKITKLPHSAPAVTPATALATIFGNANSERDPRRHSMPAGSSKVSFKIPSTTPNSPLGKLETSGPDQNAQAKKEAATSVDLKSVENTDVRKEKSSSPQVTLNERSCQSGHEQYNGVRDSPNKHHQERKPTGQNTSAKKPMEIENERPRAAPTRSSWSAGAMTTKAYCWDYHLNNGCDKGGTCRREHGRPLGNEEKEALRLYRDQSLNRISNGH